MIADDLFAGAGGWDLAAAALGIEARGIEIMPAARATREAAGLVTQHDDVWTFRPDGQATGLIASPPCQTFSPAGKGEGRKAFEDVHDAILRGDWQTIEGLHALADKVGDPRTALVLTPLHFAMTGGYDWLAWEQVTTVLPVWEACAEILRAHGWHVVTGIVNAEQYGVPQTRRRAVLLAHRHRPVKLPTPTHSRYHTRSPERLDAGVLPWLGMSDALDELEAGFTHMGDVYNSKGCIRPIGSPAPTITGAMDNGNFRWHNRCGSPSGITGPSHRPVTHPAATVTGAGNYSIHSASECGVYQAAVREGSRAVTVAEAAALQTFPISQQWQGGKGDQYLQVGNAIPPRLAHALLGEVATP